MLLVLFLATTLFAISTYQISDRYSWLKRRFVRPAERSLLLPGGLNIGWSYLITALEFILLLAVIYFLLREINKRKKINNELEMLTEHYCTVLEHLEISQRKKAAENTMKVELPYSILSKLIADASRDWDIANNTIRYNEGLTTLFGYGFAEIENNMGWWQQHIHPDDLDMVSTLLAEAFERGTEMMQLEYRFRCTDGSYKDVCERAGVIYDENRRATRFIGAIQDITNKRNEEKGITEAIITAREQERCRIGLELHDNVNQILAGTQLTLGMIKNKLGDRGRVIELIDISKNNIAHAIDELRMLSHELVPGSFNDSNLKSVFENLRVILMSTASLISTFILMRSLMTLFQKTYKSIYTGSYRNRQKIL